MFIYKLEFLWSIPNFSRNFGFKKNRKTRKQFKTQETTVMVRSLSLPDIRKYKVSLDKTTQTENLSVQNQATQYDLPPHNPDRPVGVLSAHRDVNMRGLRFFARIVGGRGFLRNPAYHS